MHGISCKRKNLQIDGGDWQSSAWRKKQTVGMSSWQLAKVKTQDWTPAMAKVADHRPGSVLAPEQWREDQFRSDQQTSTWKRMDFMADMGWAITFVLFIFSCDILSCLQMFLNTSPTRSDLEKAHLQAGSESLYSNNHAASHQTAKCRWDIQRRCDPTKITPCLSCRFQVQANFTPEFHSLTSWHLNKWVCFVWTMGYSGLMWYD